MARVARALHTDPLGHSSVAVTGDMLPSGDRGIVVDGRLVAAVEHKSLADLVASLTGGRERAPSTAEVRAWARSIGLEVPGRGRLRPGIWQAWHDTNAPKRT